jgi:hypothetical protein
VALSRQQRQQIIERRTEQLKSKIRDSTPEYHYHLRQLARAELECEPAAADTKTGTHARQ